MRTRFLMRNRSLAAPLLASALVLCPVGVMAAGSIGQPTRTAGQASARWAPRKLQFIYSSTSWWGRSYYSCDGLKDHMKSILRQLGARDVVIKPLNCARLEGPQLLPGVAATFSVLEPAAGGDHRKGSAQQVAASWGEVTLNSAPSQYFTNEDSWDLIDQVKRQVLPLFTTRDLTESRGGNRLTVEVLHPLGPPRS